MDDGHRPPVDDDCLLSSRDVTASATFTAFPFSSLQCSACFVCSVLGGNILGTEDAGLESPDFFEENNAQGEIGFHNLVVEIDGERVKLNKLIFGTGLAFAMLIYLLCRDALVS